MVGNYNQGYGGISRRVSTIGLSLICQILLLGNAQNLYPFCSKLFQYSPILPEIMPVQNKV